MLRAGSHYPSVHRHAEALFSPKISTRTSGKLRRVNATELSVEPLSTRMVSKSLKDCSRSEPKHGERNLSPFQLGITTVMRGGTALNGASLSFTLWGVDLDLRGQVYDPSEGAPFRGIGDLEGRCHVRLV